MDYSKWLNHTFSSGPSPDKDYIDFQREMRQDLKKQAERYNLELHSFSKNHYCFSAVLKDKNEDRFIYVSMQDVRGMRDRWFNCVLYRTMEHDKDWHGGMNNWCCWNKIAEKARELIEFTKQKGVNKNTDLELELER